MGYIPMRKRDDWYYTGRHSCYLLQYHLVLVTKYRKPVITGNIETLIKEHTVAYFAERNAPVMEMEVMPDHVHILFETTPTNELSRFINGFKTSTARRLRKECPKELSRFYWEPVFWSKSYFIGTVSEQNKSIVKKYIQNQKYND